MHARSSLTRVLTSLLVFLVSAATGLKWVVHGNIDCTQLAGLEKASEVIGNVHLNGTQCNEVEIVKLPLLEKITGDLNVTNMASLTRLEMPLLTEVGGIFFNIFENKLLTHILAPALKRLGLISINWIQMNPSLTKLKLPALEHLGQYLRVDKNHALRSLEVPNSPGTLKVSENSQLSCTVVSNPTHQQWLGNFWSNRINNPCEESQTCIEISGPTDIKGIYRFKKAYTDKFWGARDERDISDGIYVREVQEPWSDEHYVIRRSRYAAGWDFCKCNHDGDVPPNSCPETGRHGYIGNNGENNHNRPKTGSLIFANKASLSYCPKVCVCRGDEAAPGSRKVLFAPIPSGDGEVGAAGRSGPPPLLPCSCAEP